VTIINKMQVPVLRTFPIGAVAGTGATGAAAGTPLVGGGGGGA
jgi:hypothetical protein